MRDQALPQSVEGGHLPSRLTGASPDTSSGRSINGLSGAARESLGTAAVLLGIWVAVIAVSTIYRTDFISRQTLLSVAFTMSVAGVLTVGESLVAISGGLLDLSVPTILILPAWVAVTLLSHGVVAPLAILAAVATGAAWGSFNAFLIVFGRLNPIIVTLGTNFAGIALLNIYVQSAQTPLTSGLARWGGGYFLSLPNVFWPMLMIVAVAGYLLPRTRIGRKTIAVGGNAQAAKVRGISLRKVRFGVFVLSGSLGGVAAILFVSSTASFVSTDGAPYLFTAIAATLVAGIGLSGGSGNLWVTFLSVGLLSTVPTSLAFFGLSSLWQLVPPGLILIASVAFDGYRRTRIAR